MFKYELDANVVLPTARAIDQNIVLQSPESDPKRSIYFKRVDNEEAEVSELMNFVISDNSNAGNV